jgi:hypothetical protein
MSDGTPRVRGRLDVLEEAFIPAVAPYSISPAQTDAQPSSSVSGPVEGM